MSDNSSVSSSSSQPSRPRRWQCFLGCGQRYMKSSGRSIRRHVLACYRRQFASECKGVSDAQIHELLVSQEEKGTIHTGLKRWRLRRSRRLAMDLPPHERWDCPNQCGRYFRSTSSRSIAKHKGWCSFLPRVVDNAPPLSSASLLLPSIHAPSMLMVPSSASSSASSSSLQSFSSSASSPHMQPAAVRQQSEGLDNVALVKPLSSVRPPLTYSEPRPDILQPAVNMLDPALAAATAAAAYGSVVRPIPRLHASMPLAPSSASFPNALLTNTSSLLEQPTRTNPMSSAFHPLSTTIPFFPSATSLPPSLFNLSPLEALASLRQGYVLCAFPTQQMQVPLMQQWPY